MADDVEDNAVVPQPLSNRGNDEVEMPDDQITQHSPKAEEKAQQDVNIVSGARNISPKSFISTTESMKNAARTRVDTVIAQVHQASQTLAAEAIDNDGGGSAELSPTGGIADEEFDSKVVLALFDSVSFCLFKFLIKKAYLNLNIRVRTCYWLTLQARRERQQWFYVIKI